MPECGPAANEKNCSEDEEACANQCQVCVHIGGLTSAVTSAHRSCVRLVHCVVRLHFGWTLVRRSAIRVCQPGPVARQRRITFSGSRIEMSFRGFAERGRPPLFTVPRASMSSVSSGSSSYSCRRMTCASTRARLEPEERRDTRFLAVIGFPHAKDMAIRATRRVANHNDPSVKDTKADDSRFAVIPARILDLEPRASKNKCRILKVESAFSKGGCSFPRIEGDCHRLL